MDMTDELESYIHEIFSNLDNVEENNFDDGETQISVNAKLFLDINKYIDIKII